MATQSNIEQLYLDNLGRAASDEEKSWWSNYSGDTEAAIKASPESQRWVNQSAAPSTPSDYGDSGGTRFNTSYIVDSADNTIGVSTDFGNTYTAPPSDFQGIPGSTSYLNYGQDSGPSNAVRYSQSVEDWYKNQFGRIGESAGIDYWNKQLEESGNDYSSVFDEFIKAGQDTGEERGLYSTDIFSNAYLQNLQSGLQGGQLEDPGDFTGSTWQDLDLYQKQKAAYEAQSYLKQQELQKQWAIEKALAAQKEQEGKEEETSALDAVSGTYEPVRSEQYQQTRENYYTNIMRNDPTRFSEMMIRAQETNPELYSQLKAVQEREQKRKEGVLSGGREGFQSRLNVLEQMKLNNPDAYTSVMTAMQNRNPELFAVLTDFMGGTDGS